MAKVGDRVVMEGGKVGAVRREGTLVGMSGPLLRVRWGDGQETLLTKAPGSIQFLPGKGSGKAAAAKPARAKTPAGAKARPAAKAATRRAPAAKATAKAPVKKAAKPAVKKGAKKR